MKRLYLPVLFLLRGRFFWFFALQGQHVVPVKAKFDREERLLTAKFYIDRPRGMGTLRSQKREKFGIFPI